jgi:hypothetical protein
VQVGLERVPNNLRLLLQHGRKGGTNVKATTAHRENNLVLRGAAPEYGLSRYHVSCRPLERTLPTRHHIRLWGTSKFGEILAKDGALLVARSLSTYSTQLELIFRA